MQKLSSQSLILLLCFVSVSLWQQTPYTEYSIHLVGVLAILYVFSSRFRKKQAEDDKDTHELPTIVLLLVSVLMLLSLTGGINSLLFFLLYFLPFYLGSVLSPGIVFVFVLLVIGFFLPEVQAMQAGTLIKLAALLLFAPVAFILGRTLQEKQAMKRADIASGKQIVNDVSEIIKTEGDKLDDKTVEKLKDIVDTSRELGKERS